MKRSTRSLLTALLTLIVAYAVICLAAYLFQGNLIYHPYKQVIAVPSDYGMQFEEFRLLSPDTSEFIVWRISHPAEKAVVVFFHGNAENISCNNELYRMWYNLGVSVIAFEYRGYLNSSGEPSEQTINNDLRVLADSLQTWYDNKSTKMISAGRSLGGAVAVKFASIYPVHGLLLEATFSSMADVATHRFPFLPVKLLLKEQFDSESLMDQLAVPVMIIHSPADEVIPFHLGRKLYNAADEPKEFVTVKGGHNTYVEESSQLLDQAYRRFLSQLLVDKIDRSGGIL